MKPRLLLLCLLCALLAGCGGDPKKQVTGSWKIDIKSVKSLLISQGLASKQYGEALQKSLDTTVYNFNSDGTFKRTSQVGAGDQNGKWTIDGRNVKVVINGQTEATELAKYTLSDDGSKIHVSFPKPAALEMDLVKK